jgi:hypothetical protein
MSDVNKRKIKRVKVECLECGSQFNDDFKKKHEEKLHRGKRVNVKHVGAPKNPFETAAANSKNIPGDPKVIYIYTIHITHYIFSVIDNILLVLDGN